MHWDLKHTALYVSLGFLISGLYLLIAIGGGPAKERRGTAAVAKGAGWLYVLLGVVGIIMTVVIV